MRKRDWIETEKKLTNFLIHSGWGKLGKAGKILFAQLFEAGVGKSSRS